MRSKRQNFLGDDSERIFSECRVGLIGLGGGGSHIVQQLAHIGFQNYVLFDSDVIEESNLNRLVGGTVADISEPKKKTSIAKRSILGLMPNAVVECHECRWQEMAEALKTCDLVFGCVDTFAERRELEICSRRYQIPYIDIGMDLHSASGQPPVMAGQVILSMPGYACMHCLGYLTPELLAKEAALYGAAGGRPQVVWPNGVLASTAVGIAVDLLVDWTKAMRDVVYLSYRGNTGCIEPHVKLKYLPKGPCSHFKLEQVGDPTFTPI